MKLVVSTNQYEIMVRDLDLDVTQDEVHLSFNLGDNLYTARIEVEEEIPNVADVYHSYTIRTNSVLPEGQGLYITKEMEDIAIKEQAYKIQKEIDERLAKSLSCDNSVSYMIDEKSGGFKLDDEQFSFERSFKSSEAHVPEQNVESINTRMVNLNGQRMVTIDFSTGKTLPDSARGLNYEEHEEIAKQFREECSSTSKEIDNTINNYVVYMDDVTQEEHEEILKQFRDNSKDLESDFNRPYIEQLVLNDIADKMPESRRLYETRQDELKAEFERTDEEAEKMIQQLKDQEPDPVPNINVMAGISVNGKFEF